MAVTLLAFGHCHVCVLLFVLVAVETNLGNQYHGTVIWGMPLVHEEQGLSIFFACLISTDLL